MQNKILNLSDLEKTIYNFKMQKIKVVACSGSFDLLTAKHVLLLEEFKKQGDKLLVFLNSDSSVKSYKGKNRPIVCETDRALQLAALSSVDFVYIFEEINPINTIEVIRPDVYCNGGDWGDDFLEKDAALKFGAKIFSSKVSTKESTSDIVTRIQKLSNNKNDKKAIFLDRDGVLVEDCGYISSPEKLIYNYDLFKKLKELKDRYVFVIITNQSGIGRGFYTEADFEKVNLQITNEMKKSGIEVLDTFYCPHDPVERCECRKPKSKMFLDAAKKHNIVLSKSFMLGDKTSDVQAAKFCNIRTILLGEDEHIFNSLNSPHFHIKTTKELDLNIFI